MAVVTKEAKFNLSTRKLTILCGPPAAGGGASVQLADATYVWKDPATGATEVLGATDWWDIPAGSISVSTTGTVLAELRFKESDELFEWLCANSQTAQIHLQSTENFTVNALFQR